MGHWGRGKVSLDSFVLLYAKRDCIKAVPTLIAAAGNHEGQQGTLDAAPARAADVR